MVQGDEDWIDLAMVVATDDAGPAARHNLGAGPENALGLHLGPVPFAGALTTAPVVLLFSHVEWGTSAAPHDYAFERRGWPLSAVHPEAPRGVADRWTSRMSELIGVFGAQHVANSVAGLFLTPWRAARFDERLRLPSRPLMLALADKVAARDATLVLLQGADLWMEAAAVAALPPTRVIRSRTHRATEMSPANLGLAAWDHICRQIDVHAWL
ncbi:MAG TPA: hypothetical protein VLR71_17100 [Casimicrobiaceae bacterium]|nr:hypothetical protein [Casimicrobiaceae bacterium]